MSARSLRFLFRCTFFFGVLLSAGCRLRPTEREVQRSFYYWKTSFHLDTAERSALERHGVRQLYVRFFDVDWNEARHMPAPVGKIGFAQPPPRDLAIVPVVYITQEVLRRSASAQLDTLATRVADLITLQARNNRLNLGGEVQMDCDWTATNRDAYFRFLKKLRLHPLLKGRTLSATIRLHQLKFRAQSGIPPVDRGLLMCYNMGNLKDPATKNSLIDPDELSKYIGALSAYPLPLDAALPIFDWWVLFEGNRYAGLVRDFDPGLPPGIDRIHFDRDTVIGGYSFKAGQWLRHERSSARDVLRSAQHVSRQMKSSGLTVLLYHLDRSNLANYTSDELESFYRCFH